MDGLTEAEIQVLIALIELCDPKETPNNNFYTFYPASLEQAATYFRKFRLEWDAAYPSLAQRGFLAPTGHGYQLTPTGREEAKHWRDARPPIYYWYREYYTQAPYSPAYARFCEQLYGRNLCQANFSDMTQLEALIEAAQLSPSNRVLDLGCGVGMTAEYISDCTGAHVTGVDYIPEAIEAARARTRPKQDRLSFQVGNLDDLPFQPASFDTLISIDTLYMPNDLDRTLAQMGDLLVPGGRIFAFYMHMVWGETVDRESLRAEKTPLGAALHRAGWKFTARDFSEQTYIHMQRKHALGEQMRADFAIEGREWLDDYILAESESSLEPYVPETARMSRYLYHILV